MYPVLFHLGPLTIFSLWVMVAFGFFIALIIINKLVKKHRLHLKFLADYSLAIFFGGIIAARAVYVLRHLDYYFLDFNIQSVIQLFYIWDKGLNPWAGLAGLTASLIYFAYIKKEDIWKWLDVSSVGILSALTMINIGTFLDGRSYGRATDLPWGVLLTNSLYTVPIHPTQLYAAIYSGLLTVVLYQLFEHRLTLKPGTITIFALGGFSFLKFLEEFLRGDESGIILGLREAQIYALLGLVASIALYLKHNAKKSHGND